MPKYRINCSTTVSYTILVEAPTKEAAELYYDTSDGGDFNRMAEEVGWNLDDIYEVGKPDEPDLTINEDGDILSRHPSAFVGD